MSKLYEVFEPVIVGLSYYINSMTHGAMAKLAFSGSVLYIVSLFGGIDTAIKSALIIYFTDFALGILLSLPKNFNLVRFGQGLAKLGLFVILLIATNQGDVILQELMGYGKDIGFKMIYMKSWCVLYFGVHELLSLLKKLDGIRWFPLPRGLIKKITVYKETIDNK